MRRGAGRSFSGGEGGPWDSTDVPMPWATWTVAPPASTSPSPP